MGTNDLAGELLFTFRYNGNGGAANDEPLTEIAVEELADYDPLPSPNPFNRSWFGKEADLPGVMEKLGFAEFDVKGVLGALRDHRDADRRIAATPDQLAELGFIALPGKDS